MGRHSLPDARPRGRGGFRPRVRPRRVVMTTMLVLAVAAGTGIAAQSGLLSFAASCEESAVRLDVVASPDITPAVREVADRARQERVTSDGHCMDVRVAARENHAVARELAAGTSEPEYEVWLPDSGVWTARTKVLGDGVPVTPAGNVAFTPVTLAVSPDAGRALGWPRKTYTWALLADAATASDKVLLGTADPARSATGLLALAGISASAGRQGPDAQTRVAATAKVLAQRVTTEDAQVVRTLTAGGSARTGAAFLSEQAAYTHNATAQADVELFYPEDHALRLDYPFHLVDEPRLSTDEGRAAMRFLALLGEDSSRTTLAEHGFRSVDVAVPDTLVRTAGGRSPQPSTPGRAALAPLPPAAVDEALGMWTITLQSARLTTVVDVSGSMESPVPGRGTESRLDVTKASLLRAIGQFTPEDEIGLWEFAADLDGPRDYRRLVPTTRLGAPAPGGDTQRTRLSKAFKALRTVPDGSTGLYDTVLAAYKEAQASYVKGKFNALVVLTDGSNQDPVSISRATLISELQKTSDPLRPVALIAIAVGPDADRKEVDEIAKTTGGAGYEVSDPADIQSVILKAIMAVGQTGESAEQ